MKTLKYIFYFLLLLFFIVIFFYDFSQIVKIFKKQDKKINTNKIELKKDYKIKIKTYKKITIVVDKEKMVNWVYKNSFKCSKQQATSIINEVLKTKYPLIFLAIIKNESSFNVTAFSKSKAIGLMQILPSRKHIKQLKNANIIKEKRDLFNIKNNIKAGEFIFLDILKINNYDLKKTLKMYCGGQVNYTNNVLKTLGDLIINIKE